MKITLEERLQSMLNKTWMYMANKYKMLSFRITDDKVQIVTDKKWFEFPLKRINLELDNFLPVDEEKPGFPLALQIQNQESLLKLLHNNIELIQKDPTRIREVKEINSQVKTILDVFKTQMMFLRMLGDGKSKS